jgi:hypothetical protein
MGDNQAVNLVKDIKILDEQIVPHASQSVTVIIGEADGNRIVELQVKRPVHFEKMVTFQIDNISRAPKLGIKPINSLRNLLVNIRNTLLNAYSALSRPVKYQDPVFDVRCHEPNNIVHLMMHVIPFCLHVRQFSGARTKFLMAKISPPFQKLLEAFDIEPIITRQKISGSFVKIFGTRGLAAYDILDVADCPPITFVPNIYAHYKFVSPLINKEKLFIARRGARGLINHDVIESMLNEMGYQTVFMEDYTILEQLGIASEAKHVVAVHGASMGMFVLNKQLDSLIEICPPNVYHEYFALSLAGHIQKHIQIISSFDSSVAYSGWDAIVHFKNSPFSANESQIKLALNLLG